MMRPLHTIGGDADASQGGPGERVVALGESAGEPSPGGPAERVVALGGSAGGLDAVRMVLARMPREVKAAIVIVQHRARASDALAEVLQQVSPLPVLEPDDKDVLRAGRVYVAPADYHMLIEPGRVALSTDEPVLYSRPSIDVLFESVADSYGPEALGVVLTGANRDGAVGLRRIVDRGGTAMVQAPESAEAPTMPRAAAAAVPEAAVMPLEELGGAILAWIEARRSVCAEVVR
jgi:two-component system chemotaxis response regulator CheB